MNIVKEYSRIQRHYNTIDGVMKTTTICDMGAAIYTRPDGTQFSTIASHTAVSNMVENTILRRKGEVIDELKDFLPRAELQVNDPDYPTDTVTSIDVSHRLASAWFLKASQLVVDGKAQKNTGGFGTQLMGEIREKGVVPTIGYYCPNTLLHGFMLTMLDKVNPNYSKLTGLIEGSIICNNITRIMNAGVSMDVVTPTISGMSIEGLKATKSNKLSGMALGHVPISESNYLTGDNPILSLRVNYKGIDRLPLPVEMRDMLCDLANYQVTKFLSEEIEVRRDTTLYPQDNINYNIDEFLERLQNSLTLCRELGYINPNLVTGFQATFVPKK